MHTTALICPHRFVLPNVVGICLSGVHAAFDGISEDDDTPVDQLLPFCYVLDTMFV